VLVSFPRQPPRRAFTLTELLVSIAVIALLAAILVPAAHRVVATAGQAKCAANLRQIGVALSSYASDHSLVLPYGYWVSPAGDRKSWDLLISDYLDLRQSGRWLESAEVMHCPADDIPPLPQADNYRRTYAMARGSNGFGITANGVPTAYEGIRVTSVPSPGDTIIITEFSSGVAIGDPVDNIVGLPACCVVDSPSIQLSRGNGSPNGLHQGKMNYLFADGHVASLDPQDTIGTGSMGSPKGMWTLTPND
jgi:general secretion pathway protein G